MKCRAKICKYLLVLAVVAVLSLLLYASMQPAGVFFDTIHYNSDAKKAPLQHKYSNWLGNGQALRKYLPELLAQAKGLNSRNIKAYLIIDQNVKTFLANTAPTPEELTAIHTIFHNYDLQPPANAHNYAEYCQQAGLITINDTDVFDTLERELSEHYIPEFRQMYNEHLQSGYKNGKDYSFAGDILRIAAIQHIGKAGEVVMYTDADVGVDYRKVRDLVSVKQRHIEMITSFGLRHVSHRAINATSLRKIFKASLGIFNDVFTTTAKVPMLNAVIAHLVVWHDIEKNLTVYSFAPPDNQDGSTQGGGYGLSKLKLRNFSFDLGEKADSGAINFITKKDFKSVQPFFYVTPLKFFTYKSRKLRKQIDSLKTKDPRSYALISPFIHSGDYVLVSSTALFEAGMFTGTIGMMLLPADKETHLVSSLVKDFWLTAGMRAAIFKAITLDPEEFGVVRRYADVSWVKSSVYNSTAPMLIGPLSTIYTTHQVDEWLRLLKEQKVL